MSSTVRIIFLFSLLFVELMLLVAKLPPRQFEFERSADLVIAIPKDGGTISERDVPTARAQWVERYGRGRESPGVYTRILKDAQGLAFAAVRVVPDDE